MTWNTRASLFLILCVTGLFLYGMYMLVKAGLGKLKKKPAKMGDPEGGRLPLELNVWGQGRRAEPGNNEQQ